MSVGNLIDLLHIFLASLLISVYCTVLLLVIWLVAAVIWLVAADHILAAVAVAVFGPLCYPVPSTWERLLFFCFDTLECLQYLFDVLRDRSQFKLDTWERFLFFCFDTLEWLQSLFGVLRTRIQFTLQSRFGVGRD
jgi:hypothetical protein